MKYLFIPFAIAAVAMAACTTDIEEPIYKDSPQITITATNIPPDGTRTTVQDGGTQVLWESSDEIAVFYNGTGGRFVSQNTEPAATAEFSGTLNAILGFNEGSATENPIWGLYPYREDASSDKVSVTTTLLAEQVGRAGSFAKNTQITLARANSISLGFYNVTGGLRFSLTQEGIKKVTFEGANGETLAGTIRMAFADGVPAVQEVTNGMTKITLTAPNGETFQTGQWYYFAAIPTALPNGFKMTFYKDGEYAELTSDKSVSFKRGIFGSLANVDEGLTFEPVENVSKAFLPNPLLPDNVDKASITGISFIINSDITTAVTIPTSSATPIYFELDGTTAKYYTQAEVYELTDATSLFQEWRSLRSIDLTNILTSSITDMSYMFSACTSLKSITFGDFYTGNVRRMEAMFANCWSLESLDLSGFQTGCVQDMGCMFAGCSNLKTLDLSSFNTSNVESMHGMFGSTHYGASLDSFEKGSNACCSLTELDLSSFNTSKVWEMADMFNGCVNLERVNLSGWDTRNVIYLSTMFANCPSLREVDLSSFNTENVEKAELMFFGCSSLMELDLSNFNTPKLRDSQLMFYDCQSLRKLIISHFSSECLQSASLMFAGCQNLVALDLGDCDYSTISDHSRFINAVAYRNEAIAIRCNAATKVLIENYSDDNTFDKSKVIWIGLNESLPEMPDSQNPDLYCSTDYSMHKHVKVYQEATVGRGIDIVLFGDAYSDRLIANGTYDNDINTAIEALFAYEPMKSFREYFNVYVVYVVSKNESCTGSTAVCITNGVGRTLDCEKYVRCAVSNKPMSDIAPIIIGYDRNAFNPENPGATWNSYTFSEEDSIDYGQSQISLAFVAKVSDDDSYKETVVHEFGHLFAKLEDEYTTYSQVIPNYEKEIAQDLYTHLGVGRNIDFTDDPTMVKWSKFISDSRYENEANPIGIFEGGALYSQGVWRPTNVSIMNSLGSSGGFNAPSREAIYNRIHKLAFGRDWVYDFEKFVEYDLINIGQSNTMSISPKKRSHTVGGPHSSSIPFKIVEDYTKPNGKRTVTVIMN